jgi:DNA polymerase-3 subunit alpha
VKFHELHLHDHYSALDGLNTPTEYMARAKEIGMTHLAQTNHGTLSGHRDFQRAAKEAGITPILGVEAYISATDRFDRRAKDKREDGTDTFNHIGLLAMNDNGLKNLNALNSEAWQSGFYSKPRIDMELLEQYGDDIIVLSGCIGGLLGSALKTENDNVPDPVRAERTTRHLKEIFGDRFFIEIQGHNPKDLNMALLDLAEKTGVKPVVTSDCHYARQEDLWIEEAMLILSTKPRASKDFDFSTSQKMDYLERYNYLYPDRKMTFQKIEIFLRSAAQQHDLLVAQGIGDEPIGNTDLVAQMIGEYPYYEGLDLLPTPDPSIKDLDAELRRQVMKGAKERGHDQDPEYLKRIDEELSVIKQMGFAVYFLILSDVMQWARAQGIFVGPGRGSGVSSLVNYDLFITNIDPLPYKLLFFRFLDPDRPDWPDIDVDFEVKRRYEVKEYVKKKYGYTSNIMTFNFFRGKSAIKAAASVFKIPTGEVNKATKHLTEDEDFPVLDVYETSESTKEFRQKYPEVLPLARALEGRIKGTGMHAGGTIISKEPIEKYVPMETRTDPNDDAKGRVPVIGVDMKDAESIGLIKFDFLGLNNLTVIDETIEAVRRRTGKKIDPYSDLAGLDDEKVYHMLSKGHTRGVFQCEGGPYTNLLVKMGGVENFEDLISSNALVRPGAADSSIGDAYLKGKLEGEFEYIHADAKYFTSETYGQILFQEQQMLLCTEVAGMSKADSNRVRRAISKKKIKDLQVWQPAFIEGMALKVGQKKAEFIWDDLEKSAAYAFNRAHSVGYSMISYWTAWFKVNYPTEYFNALLNNLSGTDVKIKSMFALMEAKRMGVNILLPHVNESDIRNRVVDGSIRMGLEAIKGIKEKSGAKIVDNSPYKSYAHLLEISGTKGSGISAGHIKSLNAIGAAAFEDNPRTGRERENFYEYLNIPAFKNMDIEPETRAQFRDLNEYTERDTFVTYGMVYNIKSGPGWTLAEYVDETASAGSFADAGIQIEKGKMYVFLISNNRIARFLTTEELLAGEGGAFNKYLTTPKLNMTDDEYRCIAFKTRISKKGNKVGTAVFTDCNKNLTSAMVWGKTVDDVRIPLISSAKIKPVFSEKEDGTIVLQEIR